MWFDEPPQAPAIPPTAIYLAAKNAVTGSITSGVVHKLGVCSYVTFDTHDVRPIFAAQRYETKYMGGRVEIFNDEKNLQVRILRTPKHGTLEPVGTIGSERHEYRYIPNLVEDGRSNQEYYYGKDQFVIEVSAGGVTVQIHYTLGIDVGAPRTYVPDDGSGEALRTAPAFHRYCPKGESWKISSPTTAPDGQPAATGNAGIYAARSQPLRKPSPALLTCPVRP